MRFVGVDAMVRAFLKPVAGVPVHVSVPGTRPASFVRVFRNGGGAANRVLDRPVVTVEAWAADSVAAAELADKCRHALLNDYEGMPLVRGVEEITGPYFIPDPESEVPRYRFSVRLFVRAAR